jgi:3-phosphoinositide dependent protein kinase-1
MSTPPPCGNRSSLLTRKQRDKHYVFEDPKPSSSNIGSTAVSAQEWLDALDRAREMGIAHQGGPYSADDAFRDLSSGFSSHANTLERNSELQNEHGPHQPGRLIRRHYKNGLAAVF